MPPREKHTPILPFASYGTATNGTDDSRRLRDPVKRDQRLLEPMMASPGAGAVSKAVVESGMKKSFANSHGKAEERKSADS